MSERNGLSRHLSSNWQKTELRVWELAALLGREMGKVCVEQKMGHLASRSLPSAYRLPLSSYTLLSVVAAIQGIPVCLLACPSVSLDNPTLSPPHHLLLQLEI